MCSVTESADDCCCAVIWRTRIVEISFNMSIVSRAAFRLSSAGGMAGNRYRSRVLLLFSPYCDDEGDAIKRDLKERDTLQ